LKLGTGIEVGTPDHNKVVKQITVFSTLLFFMIFTISQLIFVLHGLDCVLELSLVLANGVDGRHDEIVLGRGISERIGDDSSTTNGKGA
jgi:hypothetical protein